jgi:hypothetical protein
MLMDSWSPIKSFKASSAIIRQIEINFIIYITDDSETATESFQKSILRQA